VTAGRAPNHTINSLVVDTGGFVVFNENNLLRDLHQILDDVNGCYLIGYRPKDSPTTDSSRASPWRCPRAGVRARRSYLAVAPRRVLLPEDTTAFDRR
jgi:hypothetical protein